LYKHRKAFVDFKFLEDATGGFEGYASVFGELDSGGDIVERGAFADTLPDFLRDGFISLGHDWDGLPIGTIRDAHEDSRGLFISTEYHSTSDAQEARRIAQERIARGKSVALSIGYGIKPGGMNDGPDGARHLTNLKLFEVAQVNVPMLRPAGLTGVKGIGLDFDEHSEHLRVALSEWLERVRTGSDVRLKAGRAISEGRRGRLAVVRESLIAGASELEELLKETEPPETKPAEEPQSVVDGSPTAIDPMLLGLRSEFERLTATYSTFLKEKSTR
jgi:HK97 family phage prohead protease